MKRIIYCLAILAITFVGCNPMEDIYDGIDSTADPIVGIESYTLTDDDYADLGLGFGSFNSVEQAKDSLPAFLADRYPFWGQGSSVLVGYDLYVGNAEGIGNFTGASVYELSNADYATTGSDAFGFYPNVNATNEIPAILDAQVPSPTEGQLTLVKYDQYFEVPQVGLAPLYNAEFPADFGNFELISISGPEELGWTLGAANIQGSGFSGGPVATEDWVISPQIDLTGETDLKFQITQEIDFLADASLIDILISTDYTTGGDVTAATWTVFAFDKTLYSDLATSEDFDFSAYDGQQIHIGLKYSSTDTDSPRWRVQSMAVKTLGVSGDTNTKGEYFVYEDGSWEEANDAYFLSSADYDSMGEEFGQPGRFNNFSSSTSIDDYIPTFLNIKYPYAQADDEIFIIYNYFSSNSGAGTRGQFYTFMNGSWMAYQSTISTSLQFGFDNGMWVPDNTIRYTFADADYTLVAAALAADYPNASSSMANFGNMDRRSGNVNEWTNPMVLEAIAVVLNNLNPSAADEQKYIVTISVYNGTNTTEDFAVIKSGGEWVYQN